MAESLHPSEWDTLLKFHIEIGNVKDDERLLVLVTHGFVELLVNTLIEAKCKHGNKISSDSRGYTQSIKLVILHELGLIEDDLYQILDWFRKLRNKAAHEPFFEITPTEWDIIKKFLDNRSPNRRGRSELHQFCLVLEGAVWNSHGKIFASVFKN